ncbi:LTA synthase family protein [Streptococcus sobrinus]|uniref:LTA synthase family protein n=1 Tax=Streptococcus sobrinus TaxID=1310 RepID=UPI0002E4C687|nr:LTA synthase family protein [Streptococcus sobrinus]
MKKFLRDINWYRVLHITLICLFAFCINFFLVNQQILEAKSASKLHKAFQGFELLTNSLYGISIVGLAVYVSESLKKSLWIQYAIGYVIYLLVSYFLVVTRNLNNGGFKFWSLVKNQFFQGGTLPTVLMILVLAIVIHYISEEIKNRVDNKQTKHSKASEGLLNMDRLLKDYDAYQLPISLFLGTAVLSDRLLILPLRGSLKVFFKSVNVNDYIWALGTDIAICLLLYSLLSYFSAKGLKDAFSRRASISLSVTTSFLLALIFNFILQSTISVDGKILGRYIFPGAVAYQILVIALVNVIFYMVVNRYLIATTILIALGTTLSVANQIKYSMRNEPVLFSDLSWLKDIRMLLSYIDVSTIFFAIFGIVVLAAATYFLWKLLSFKDTINSDWRMRVVVTLPILILFTVTLSIFSQQDNGQIAKNIPILSKLNNTENIEWMGQSVVARERSLMFLWTKQLTSSKMERPSGYSKSAMDKIAKNYTKKAQTINKSRKGDISDQTVIFVLSESFADPSRLSDVSLNRDPIPYIKSVKQNNTSGLMKSDSYGGGTANMEFQTLTGLPMYNISSSISTIYSEVVPEMSRVPSISDSYSSRDKIAIHLGDANTYSRKSVYRRLGFDKFIAATGGTEKAKHLGTLGVYPSDANTYQTVMDNLNPSRNQFFSVITYQNHTPWDYTDDSPYGGSGDGFDPAENSYADNYAKELKQTDDATKDWLSKLSKIDKKITVVFYGDHLPGFYPEKTFKDNPKSQYQTDYFIWSNYPTPKQNHPYVNSSDFPAELLLATSTKVSPYQALLTEVLDNASVDKEHKNKEQKKIAEDLKLVEYDLISGKGYLANDDKFFQVDKGN